MSVQLHKHELAFVKELCTCRDKKSIHTKTQNLW